MTGKTVECIFYSQSTSQAFIRGNGCLLDKTLYDASVAGRLNHARLQIMPREDRAVDVKIVHLQRLNNRFPVPVHFQSGNFSRNKKRCIENSRVIKKSSGFQQFASCLPDVSFLLRAREPFQTEIPSEEKEIALAIPIGT